MLQATPERSVEKLSVVRVRRNADVPCRFRYPGRHPRGYEPAVAWFASLDEVPLVAGFVVMELIQDADNKNRVHKALKLVEPLQVVWPKEADLDRALADYKSFHLSHGLGLLDSLIAATATGHQATLCTFNVKHFKMLAEIEMQQPYAR